MTKKGLEGEANGQEESLQLALWMRNIAIVRIVGVLESEKMRAIRTMLEDLEEEGVTHIVLDFEACEHFYYRLVDLIVLHKKILEEKQGALLIAGMNDYLNNIVALFGYADTLPNYETAKEAVREVAC